MVQAGEHTSFEGQAKIKEIQNQLSSRLNFSERSTLPPTNANLTPEQIIGFVDAEGNFYFTITKPKNNPENWYCKFRFTITPTSSESYFLNQLFTFLVVGM